MVGLKLNLDYYSGEDLYSDGDIENELLRMVGSNVDHSDILATDTRWPVLYHLSPVRRNVLEWYDFDGTASLLEIGAGCGALTGLFCEKNRDVVAVELSKRRAEIIAERHKERSNLEIVVGNLNDIRFRQRFDFITLIGVLEYAGKFTRSSKPYHDFLEQVKGYLKPDGTLIIAIENKFGLKYWAGAKEDHTNRYFDGIEDYPVNTGVRTFGKSELTELVHAAGFDHVSFHYPMPDYKLPLQVFSDSYLPRPGQIGNHFPNYDNDRFIMFNERLAYDNLVRNGQFDFFANSFLVFCSKVHRPVTTIFSKFNRERLPRYQIETSIRREKGVATAVKKPLTPEARAHIRTIGENHDLLQRAYADSGVVIAEPRAIGLNVGIRFVEGKSLDILLVESVISRDLPAFHALFDRYAGFVRGLPGPARPDDAKSGTARELFGEFPDFPDIHYAGIANIDLKLDNMFVRDDGRFEIIDYEWIYDVPVPVNFILYRSIRDFWCKYDEYLRNTVSRDELFARHGIPEAERGAYDAMEKSFQAHVNGPDEKYRIRREYRKEIIHFSPNSTYSLKEIIRKPRLLFRRKK